jgi:hypothetical protein
MDMMKRISAGTVLALLAACGSAGEGGKEAARSSSTGPALTIAGVGIGTSAVDAQRVLVGGGWKVETFPGRDWATTVAEEAGRQRGKSMVERPRNGLETIQASKGDESMIVDLRPVPSGAEVRFVKYEAPMGGRSGTAVSAELVGRYGPATVASPPGAPLDMTWCSGGERCRSAVGAANPAMGAKEDVYHKLRLSLSGGIDGDRAWSARVQKATGGAPVGSSF